LNKIKVISTSRSGNKYERMMPTRYKREHRKKQPWYVSWVSAKNRCNNRNNPGFKHYGGRRIQFDLPFWYMGVLYYRDKAPLMKTPTIDRIDNNKNYIYDNCRFIERSENTSKRNRENTPWNKGMHHSKETKLKISISQKKRLNKKMLSNTIMIT